MKKALSHLMITTFVLLTIACKSQATDGSLGGETAQSDQQARRYKVKSGIIEYKMTGMQNGRELLYFDNWGLREAKYTQTEISVMGMTQKENKVTVLAGNKIYTYDPVKRTGTVMENSTMSNMSSGAKSRGKDMTDMGMDMIEQMGGKKIGQEKIAGFLADVYEIKQMGTKAWVYNGVTLKSEGGFAGMKVNSEAVKAQFNIEVPEGKLQVPTDVKITKMPDIMKRLKK